MGFMTLAEWIEKILPSLIELGIKRIDGTVEEGDVTAYWAGTVLRIDLKAKAILGQQAQGRG